LGGIGVAPIHTDAATAAWFTVAGDAYCKGLRPQECRDAELSREGKLPRLAFYAKSDVASQPWPAAAFETIVEWLERRQRDRVLTPENFAPTHNIGKVFLEACDGATNDIARDAAAFPHRSARFITQFQTRWSAGAPASTIDANIAWTNGLYDAVAPYRSGMAYLGYADPLLADWQRAYFGDNLRRLRAIKAKYDPQNFFRFARSITA
ncbi:MAG TPA: BBE domain-containing protein, partial [Thermoanaerobaculia bacterium]|nr:BBE domain-containing protein [Thermoanaerobaculia bacterium]